MELKTKLDQCNEQGIVKKKVMARHCVTSAIFLLSYYKVSSKTFYNKSPCEALAKFDYHYFITERQFRCHQDL